MIMPSVLSEFPSSIIMTLKVLERLIQNRVQVLGNVSFYVFDADCPADSTHTIGFLVRSRPIHDSLASFMTNVPYSLQKQEAIRRYI
jgi:hypothetical protein